MRVKIVKTCEDCDRWNRETLQCQEWAKGCAGNAPCCLGASTGMIPATLLPVPDWLQAEVDAINAKINDWKEKSQSDNEKEES